MPASPADTVSAAYQRGIDEELQRPAVGSFVFSETSVYAPTNMRPVEIREAVDNWTAACSDHAHTSFWGAFHCRAMRAYWLGRLRATRL